MSPVVDSRQELHRPFHGRRGRAMGWGIAVAQGAVLLGAAALVRDQLGPFDWLGFLVIALLVGWFLSRLATVAAFPDEDGLLVRNLLLSRRLEWAEIVEVRFAGGDPWALLDLSDGDTLAVMGIQRADGALGRAEADRLATLVALHSPR